MNLVLMALYDEKLQAFMTPFFAQAVGAAVRQLADLVNGPTKDGEPAPAMHPEDFSLYRLAEWSPSGSLFVGDRPELVCRCVDLVREK